MSKSNKFVAFCYITFMNSLIEDTDTAQDESLVDKYTKVLYWTINTKLN